MIDRDKVWRDFAAAVNMGAGALAAWLETEESRRVGFKRDGGASIGHASGRRIVGILGRKKAELSGEDYRHMQKTVGFVRRHLAQRPANEVTSRWRYSLMNWGHDPLHETSFDGL
jgi:hypothetical protein